MTKDNGQTICDLLQDTASKNLENPQNLTKIHRNFRKSKETTVRIAEIKVDFHRKDMKCKNIQKC